MYTPVRVFGATHSLALSKREMDRRLFGSRVFVLPVQSQRIHAWAHIYILDLKPFPVCFLSAS